MIIYLDFDGTVVEHAYPKIGRANFGCIEVIKKLQDAGHNIILNTYRADIGELAVKEALHLLNEMPYALLKDRSKIAEFEINPITHVLKSKLHPIDWDWHLHRETDTIFIDDITPNIPLKPAIMVQGNMVDWDAIDREFVENGMYN
jgi:hypothetical protein